MNLVSVVMCGVLLSKESLLSALNLPRLLFFVPLILIGYTSVVITVIEMVQAFHTCSSAVHLPVIEHVSFLLDLSGSMKPYRDQLTRVSETLIEVIK